jgi:hypothetical protein
MRITLSRYEMLKIVFAAYRDWALELLPVIKSHPSVSHVHHVTSIKELEDFIAGTNENFDMVMLCGWSWQVSQDLLAKVLVVSEHPAYLDDYSLGTPLQGQISDGITHTKHRVVKIGYPELGERLYSPDHEVDMNLTGNMDDILSEMKSTAKTIYTRFLDDYPNFEWRQWPKSDSYRTPRKPADSKITLEQISSLGTAKIYDVIRMLESPYPNAFIEDDDGILYFNRVSYKRKR